jgi:transposase
MKTGAMPNQTLIVMEATGIYWMAVATFLAREGYAVSIVNPSQAHHFAKALLKRAKTDAIDAQTLTQLAALLQPALWVPPPAIYEELEQRLTQRDTLLLLRGQLHALRHNPVVVVQVESRKEALDQMLTAQITEIEAELIAFLSAESVEMPTHDSVDQSWIRNIIRLQTIPGVGLITAMWIVRVLDGRQALVVIPIGGFDALLAPFHFERGRENPIVYAFSRSIFSFLCHYMTAGSAAGTNMTITP